MTWRVKVTFDPPLKEFKRRWNRARILGAKAAGNLWIDMFLKRHFETKWARKYGYGPRIKNLSKTHAEFRKRFPNKPLPEQRPLIVTGRSVDKITRSAKARARGAGGNVLMLTPVYFPIHGLNDELTRTLPEERTAMAGAALGAIVKSWSRVYTKRTIEAGAR